MIYESFLRCEFITWKTSSSNIKLIISRQNSNDDEECWQVCVRKRISEKHKSHFGSAVQFECHFSAERTHRTIFIFAFSLGFFSFFEMFKWRSQSKKSFVFWVFFFTRTLCFGHVLNTSTKITSSSEYNCARLCHAARVKEEDVSVCVDLSWATQFQQQHFHVIERCNWRKLHLCVDSVDVEV